MNEEQARAAVVAAARKVSCEQELFHLDASVYEGAEGVPKNLKDFVAFPIIDEQWIVTGIAVHCSEKGTDYGFVIYDEIAIPELRFVLGEAFRGEA